MVDHTSETTGVGAQRPIAVVRVRPTRTQRMWWFHLALFGSLSAAGSVAIVHQWGPEEGLLPAIIWPGLLISIGAFASGKFLRQRWTAEATAISVSDDGTLTVHEPSGDTSCSLVAARRISVRHGVIVGEVYGAQMPDSLASSGPRGAIVIECDDRDEILEFTGELPLQDQRQLLSAAERFLPRGAGEPVSAAATPDERFRSAPRRRRLLDFGALSVKVLVLMLPFWAFIVIQTGFRGHLDPNTRWLQVLIVAAGAAVVVAGLVRLKRR